MDTSSKKEELSITYISALCAVSGISFDRQFHDDDSTDATIKKLITLPDGRKCEAILRVQLKATSSTTQYKEDDSTITYVLKAKNYNDLKTISTTPIVLALLILPEKEDEWVTWTHEELMIKGRMYWQSFESAPEIENKSSITVKIPKENYLNSDRLLELLQRVAEEV